jgi:hypothetical protein
MLGYDSWRQEDLSMPSGDTAQAIRLSLPFQNRYVYQQIRGMVYLVRDMHLQVRFAETQIVVYRMCDLYS